MKKKLFAMLGIMCVAAGAVGIITPVLPTTPFLLLAAYLFSKSSPRMRELLLENKIFGKYLSDYFSGKPIPPRQKAVSIAFVWLGLGLAIFLADLQAWLIALLIAIGIAVSIHLATLGRFRKRRLRSKG